MSSVTLADVSEAIVDCEHKTAPAAALGSEYAYSVGTPHLRDGRIILSQSKRVDKSTYEAWTARAVPREGDLIFAREAPVGQVGRVGPTERVCLGQRTVLIRPDSNRIHPRFLHYLLLAPQTQERMHSKAGGSTVAHLNVADIRGLVLPTLPARATQEAIADLLGALDDKIVVNENTSNAALELGGATYDAASRTSDWKDVSLRHAARWYSGGTPSTAEPTFWSGDIPWISAASLKSPWLDESDRKVTELGASNGTRLAPKGTVIFVVRGMSLKTEFRIGIARRTVAFGQDCKALVPLDGITGDLLLHAIRNRSSDVLDLVDEAGHGTGRLATDRIEQMVIRAPSDRSDRINEALQNLNDLASSRQRESRTLTDLRDLLLPKLMSGEIRVRAAEKVVEEAL
ncbi:restriction endonuclease subunit S [Dactylosporangium sp. NPDC051485]|uniref:restriction endonuclease subunit S n=1 Tax=Dactylosporangium sp. NPDC051485 TaxID=3154846 RepID=UPI00341D47DE